MDTTRNIDAEISEAEKHIELHEALLRLEGNPDFKKVIGDYFLGDFAKKLVMQRALPEFRANPTLIESVDRKIDAVGEFANWMRSTKAIGTQAAQKLPEQNALRERIIANGGELDVEVEE